VSFGVALPVDNSSPTAPARLKKKKSTASWGFRPAGSRPSAAPDRYAILPPGIPMMSRLRRHPLVPIGMIATIALLSSAHRLNQPLPMAFQKSQADRAACNRGGQEERKRFRQGRFPGRPALLRSSNRGFGVATVHDALRASQASDFSGARPTALRGITHHRAICER